MDAVNDVGRLLSLLRTISAIDSRGSTVLAVIVVAEVSIFIFSSAVKSRVDAVRSAVESVPFSVSIPSEFIVIWSSKALTSFTNMSPSEVVVRVTLPEPPASRESTVRSPTLLITMSDAVVLTLSSVTSPVLSI